MPRYQVHYADHSHTPRQVVVVAENPTAAIAQLKSRRDVGKIIGCKEINENNKENEMTGLRGLRIIQEDGSETIPVFVWDDATKEWNINGDEEIREWWGKQWRKRIMDEAENKVTAALVVCINDIIEERVEDLYEKVDDYLDYAGVTRLGEISEENRFEPWK